jgi:hypothetical protein
LRFALFSLQENDHYQNHGRLLVRYAYFSLTMLAGFVLMTENAVAGAWTQKRGMGYYELKFQLIRANRFYEPDGRIISIPTLAEYTASLYGEYGLNDWLTVIGDFPFYKRITLNRQIGNRTGFVFFPGDSVSGISDAEIGVRVGLRRGGSTVISAGLKLGLPIGDDTQTSGLLTGDGEFNQILSLQLGHSFYPKPLYFTGEIGVNNRTNGYSDEFRYEAELGYTFGSALTMVFKINGLEPFRNGDDAVTGGMGGLFANNQRYLAYGPGAFYNITKSFGITARAAFAVRGQNVLARPAYFVGIFLKQ